jgi:hypothetical protein
LAKSDADPELRFEPEGEAALLQLRSALLQHHRVLVDLAQRDYEREHGRIEGPGKLLHLLMQDPDFGWLRGLSALIARLDEALESPLPGDAEDLVEALARLLLEPEAGADDARGFGLRYQEALQRSPEVVVSHGRLAGTLRPLRSARFPLHPAGDPPRKRGDRA